MSKGERKPPVWFKPMNGGEYVERVRATRHADGVYCIRQLRLLARPRVVYVGQSSTGCLYRTLTRHFQQWSRSDRGQFWKDMRGPIHTYDPDSCEVAIFVVPRSEVGAVEAALIAKLNPRDNPGSAPF